MKKLFLPLRSLHHHPARTFILALLVCCLAFSVFSGSVLILSLRNGLYSLENRMGADVIAVPSTAKSKTNLEQMMESHLLSVIKSTGADEEYEINVVVEDPEIVFLAS